MSTPVGILISNTLILTLLDDSDKFDENSALAESHFNFFLIVNTIVVLAMVAPSLFLIQD